jgi:hypothetical protein
MDASLAAFAKLIDYAGLFPPASLPLDDVIERYARYRADADAWLLGRLIVPADRLAEAAERAGRAGATFAAPWPISVLVGGSGGAAVRVGDVSTNLRVEAVEATARTADEIAAIADQHPATIERFIEIPADPDPARLIDAIAQAGCAAKIRTGGTTADKFPSTEIVARFLARAVAAHVPIKATAGLHHALRASYPLTYAAGSPVGTMHGFANLVFAAALLTAEKIDEWVAEACLDDDRPNVFKFGGRSGSWLNAVLTYGELADARQRTLRCVGSCSFEEPRDELRRLGWA